MLIVEEILLIIGFLMLPYGLYEIVKSSADKAVKILLVSLSIVLFIVETILTIL
ncbi:MAG: hypothetical protein QW550_01680 [Saccharolobus sp.]